MVIAALLLLVISARSLSSFYLDVLWFRSVDRSDVYWGSLSARGQLGLIFAFGFAAVLWLNMVIADRMAPMVVPDTPEDRALLKVRETIAPYRAKVRLALALVLGLLAGIPAATHWQDWILFRNSKSFGAVDPLFDTDIGFYVFQLPFAEFAVAWAFAATIFIILLIVGLHFLNGGIRPQARADRLSAQSKVHLSVLLAIAALLRAVSYWLSRYDLTRSQRGVVRGALYTDVNAQLPATNLMILVSVAVATLLLWNVRQKGWRLPALAVGLWVVVALVAGTVYPAVVQRLVVQPNVSTRELPFIERNIEATKKALAIDAVERVETTVDPITAADVEANDIALRNVRLLDVTQMRERFALDEGLTSFYTVRDLDVDRYKVDGRTQQVIIAARELNIDGLPNRTWVSRHLLYTHGCSVIAAPASVVTEDGRPSYVELDVDRPELYFGEGLGHYALVGTDQSEQACPGTTSTPYAADAGVTIDSTLRRLAFAVSFGEFNMFGSRLITDRTQVLWIRDVRERVAKVAPFLHVDGDPYPVVVNGGVKWVVDLYTTTNRYPYAEAASTSDLASRSGLAHDFNYVRNSVKAVVDAYSGAVTFYVVDAKDPILRAWRAAFPEMFTPVTEAEPELVQHFRYPEDLFRVQSNAYGRYQFDDATLFFNRDAAWNVSQEVPRSPEGVVPTATTVEGEQTPAESDTIDGSDSGLQRISPYYTIFQPPGGVPEDGYFAMLRSFVPFSADDSRKELRALMVVSSDPATYGRITVYEMQTPLPPGPATVAAEFDSDAVISEVITPLDLRGSRVVFGDLQTVPVGKGLIFVRPMYVLPEGDNSRQIFVRKILAHYDGRSVIGDSLTQVVARLFPGFDVDLGDRITQSTPTTTVPGGTTPTTVPTSPESAAELLLRADELFAEADDALAESPPDFATFQAKQAEARELVSRALAQLR